MENPSLYFRNNVVGSLNLLESMDIYKCNKLIFSSSCVVYGEGQYLPIDEKHPKEPTNPYGESKLIVEKMINWFITQKNLRAVCLRYFNPCGASTDGLMGDAKKPSVHLIQNIVRGALNIEPFKLTAPKVDTPDGSPIRDYIDINDLVDAHWKALSYLNDGGKSDVFNLGTGKGVSVLEAVQAVEKILKVNIPLENGETRKGEYAAVYADYDKARNVLGWEPSTPIIKSVENMVKWYSSHPQGYNSLS
jgi:UDP-glucose 4-epimerase